MDPTPEFDPIEQVLGFFTLLGQGKGLRVGQYSAERELQLLVEAAESEDFTIRLAAIEAIRKHLKEALILSGGVQQLTAMQLQTFPDGKINIAQLEGQQLRPIASTTQRMLEAGATQEELIDMETINAERTYKSDHSEPAGVVIDVTPEENSAKASTNSDANPVKYRRRGEPVRDLGGGGICVSSQDKARDDRRDVADEAERFSAGSDEEVGRRASSEGSNDKQSGESIQGDLVGNPISEV